VIDALLLTLFAGQHSVMARAAFKRRWTRLVPRHAERSAYVLAASAVLALTFWQWRPIPAEVWDVHAAAPRAVLWALFGLGWVLVVGMTFAIDHLDLVGLRQVWRHRRGQGAATPEFKLPLPYRLVRHPMMTGFFLALLATPVMTRGHLLFALLSCGYIVVAVRLEERDLTAALPEYRDYAADTPRFVPTLRRGRAAVTRSR
jgi:protein-S-isoprenylcysteine O-methyltransferase Ste14